jgi:rubrerythrin
MSLLKIEPPAPVRSLAELFALALAIEEEAAARYAALAEEMLALHLPEVATVFRKLAEEERHHATYVGAWSSDVTGTLPDQAWIRWRPPETFDEDEARQIASSRLASAYRALSMAVRNEERAFALWTYISAQAEAPEIRQAAEQMAREELGHAALLRSERRRAFHVERSRGGMAAGRAAPLRRAFLAEQLLTQMMSAPASEPSPSALGVTERQAIAVEAKAMAGTVAGLMAAEAEVVPTVGCGVATEEAPLRLAEQALEAYLDAADAASDEDLLRQLQSLAKRAIARIALMRGLAEAG